MCVCLNGCMKYTDDQLHTIKKLHTVSIDLSVFSCFRMFMKSLKLSCSLNTKNYGAVEILFWF